jgi:hypothetical protein
MTKQSKGDSTEIAVADQQVLDHVRARAIELKCRIEISSDLIGDLPISASNADRTRYGFGKSIAEAVGNLHQNPRSIRR